MRIKRLLMLVLAFLSSPTLLGDERWYVFHVDGTPAGHAVEESEKARTRTEIVARLSRLGKSIDMRFETISLESDAGELQSLTFETVLSKQASRLEAQVGDESVRIVSGSLERTIPLGATRLLGPHAVATLSAAKLRAAGDEISYAVFSPELQRIATVRRRVIATRDRACNGTVGTKLEEVTEGVPTARTLWLDANGHSIGDSIASPFGPMTTCRSTKEAAMTANSALPPDVFERTLIRSNVRFRDPFAADRVLLRITRRDAAHPLPDFSAHNQKVVSRTDDEVVLEVRRDGGPAFAAAEYLQPNAIIESANGTIVKTAGALKRETSRETAEELTRWVAENLSMDAGIVLAPASESIRDRRGTCVGYATLLAALARAAGIPARVAIGYVYYGGIWGGHAWTEMMVDGRWLPFDAAVYAPGLAHAARIAAGTTSFADGAGDLQVLLGTLFGRIDIKVVEYEVEGRTSRVAATAPAFEIKNGVYENPALGLHITSSGWTIERADATWPSTLVVAFRKSDDVVELHHRPANPKRAIELEGDAMLVERTGGMLWVWSARGPNAASALRNFAR